MKILITGFSGLVGSNLFNSLVSDGHEVFGVARTNRHNAQGNILLGDLTDPEFTEQVFEAAQPEVVYHLAANGAESRGQISPIDMTQRNLGMATNVLRSAINAGVKRFVFASSISVYGDAKTPYTEYSEPQPKDVYGVNKLAFEQMLKIMAKVYGFEYVILRPHNIYGIGQNMADPSKNVIALFMRKLLERKPYILFGDGKMYRGFSYVEDVVKIFVEARESYTNLTLNIGSQSVTSIKELSDILQVVAGFSVPIEYKPARLQEMQDFIASHDFQNALGIPYQNTSLITGLYKTWEWVQKQPLPELQKMEDEIYVHTS